MVIDCRNLPTSGGMQCWSTDRPVLVHYRLDGALVRPIRSRELRGEQVRHLNGEWFPIRSNWRTSPTWLCRQGRSEPRIPTHYSFSYCIAPTTFPSVSSKKINVPTVGM